MPDHDVLTDVLRAVRLRGTVYFHAEFGAPWGMAVPPGEFANFHAVSKNGCWLRVDALGIVQELQAGDVVVFPHGTPHALVHAPDGAAVPAPTLLGDNPTGTSDRRFGGDGVTTGLTCGHFELDRAGRHPLITTLPAILHIRRSALRGDWVNSVMKLAVHESGTPGAGGPAVVDRLAEVLLIQVLRAHSESTDDTAGFLAALSDAAVSRVLLAIHREPARAWTLNELASEAHVSRTNLATRFKQFVGMAPMRYLTMWRLQKSRELLVTTQLTTARVAGMTGYDSPFAFARAFKRQFGVTPGDVRKAG